MAIDPLPKFAMISTDIRRDLVLPMRGFSNLKLLHFYRQAPYSDLTAEDLDESLIRYSTPSDLLRALRRTRPDIIQNVELFSLRQLPYIATICCYARVARVPLIAGVHIGRPLKEKYGMLPATAMKLVLQPVLHQTRLFFYLNKGGKRNLRWMGVPESKLVRHMYGTWGIDPDEFTPERDGREPAWPDRATLLYVGRIHEEKGLFYLLDALNSVCDAVPNTRLILIGDGPHRAEAEKRVEAMRLTTRVTFLGTVKNRDLPAYFRAATLFVSPAVTTRKWEEYVGMTNIQAMACGVPVVSTLSGAIPEYVPDGEAGILVPERDPAALAKAIIELLTDDELRRSMGRQARAYVSGHYNARDNVCKAEALILESWLDR